jgi:rod shape determining protein RodA
MAQKFGKMNIGQRIAPWFVGFDGPLAFAVFLLACAGLLTMYSSGFDHGTRFADHGRNMLIAGAIMFVVAQIPPQRLMALAVPLYVLGVSLLIAVAIFGLTKKGARRWLNLGVTIQPSEILKIAMPLMLAWWFQKREGQLRPLDFTVAAVIFGGTDGPDRQAARPGHRNFGDGGWAVGDLFRWPVLEMDCAALVVGLVGHGAVGGV